MARILIDCGAFFFFACRWMLRLNRKAVVSFENHDHFVRDDGFADFSGEPFSGACGVSIECMFSEPVLPLEDVRAVSDRDLLPGMKLLSDQPFPVDGFS